MYAALFASIPAILYQLWAFIAPGLYHDERELAMPLLISSVVLFYAGLAFCYFLVFPLVFTFFAMTTPEGVAMMTDISKYLDFVLGMFFAFGIAFETPVIVVLLVWSGVVSPQALAEKRRYIVVLAFVIAMLLTPPDVTSQIMLAIPLLLLFELGLLVARLYHRKKDDAKEDAAEPFNDDDNPSPSDSPERSFGTPRGAQPVSGTTADRSSTDADDTRPT